MSHLPPDVPQPSASIHDLPIEIITRVLTIVCEDFSRGNSHSHYRRLKPSAEAVSRVCRGWRAFLYEPAGFQFWIASIYISDTHPHRELCADLALMYRILETSQSCDLDITVFLTRNMPPGALQSAATNAEQRLVLHSIRLLTPHAHQIRCLVLGSPPFRCLFSMLVAFAPMPRLREVHLVVNWEDQSIGTSIRDDPSEILQPLQHLQYLDFSRSSNCTKMRLNGIDIFKVVPPPSLANLAIGGPCEEDDSPAWNEVVNFPTRIGTVSHSRYSHAKVQAADHLPVDREEVRRVLHMKHIKIVSDLNTFVGILCSFSTPALERLTIDFSREGFVGQIPLNPKELISLQHLTLKIDMASWTETHDAVIDHLLPSRLESFSLMVRSAAPNSQLSFIPASRTRNRLVQELNMDLSLVSKLDNTLSGLACWDPVKLTIVFAGSARWDLAPGPSSFVEFPRLQSLLFRGSSPNIFLQFLSRLSSPQVQRVYVSLHHEAETDVAIWEAENIAMPHVLSLIIEDPNELSKNEFLALLRPFSRLEELTVGRYSRSTGVVDFGGLVSQLDAVKHCLHLRKLILDVLDDHFDLAEVMSMDPADPISLDPEVHACIRELIADRKDSLHPLEVLFTAPSGTFQPIASIQSSYLDK
jgi:hypothetical protein